MTPAEYYKRISKDDRDAIANLKEITPFMFIPTGSWVINSLIGDGTNNGKAGGFPRGHIVEIMGDESSGKTTLGMSAIKQCQLQGGIPIWLDFERTFHKQYAKNIGIDLDPNKLVLIEPNHFQHGAKFINDALLMKPPLIVVDSVSAMIPKEVLEGAIDEGSRIGLQAQLMSMFLAYITKKLQPVDTCLVFINQMRSVIKSQYERGPSEESSGGKALRYYAAVRIKLETGKVETVSEKSLITGKTEKKPVNIMVNVKMIKNRIDRPFLSGPVFIRFGEGFDNYMSIIELAENSGVVKRSGPFYKFEKGDRTVFNVQGREQLRDLLKREGPEYQELLANLVFKEDEKTKAEAIAEDSTTEDELDKMLTATTDSFKKAKGKK